MSQLVYVSWLKLSLSSSPSESFFRTIQSRKRGKEGGNACLNIVTWFPHQQLNTIFFRVFQLCCMHIMFTATEHIEKNTVPLKGCRRKLYIHFVMSCFAIIYAVDTFGEGYATNLEFLFSCWVEATVSWSSSNQKKWILLDAKPESSQSLSSMPLNKDGICRSAVGNNLKISEAEVIAQLYKRRILCL